MKPNEIIGFGAMVGAIVTWIVSANVGFTIWTLVIMGLFGLIEITFFSLWGIFSFNQWVEKKR